MNEEQKRILILDPDDRDRAVLTTFLRNEGYEVNSSRTLPEAFKKIFDENFGCLLLEVDLPEMKGYDAVPLIKRLSPEIKVIMTAKVNNKALESKIREQQIFFYFLKTFNKEELKLAIQNAFKT